MKKINERLEKIRLDKFLNSISKLSRSEISKIISNGMVRVNADVETKPSKILKFNDVIEMEESPKVKDVHKLNSNYNLNIPSFLLELDMEYIIFDQSNIDKYITNNRIPQI